MYHTSTNMRKVYYSLDPYVHWHGNASKQLIHNKVVLEIEPLFPLMYSLIKLDLQLCEHSRCSQACSCGTNYLGIQAGIQSDSIIPKLNMYATVDVMLPG